MTSRNPPTFLMPRPWGNCGCARCVAWMLEDLQQSIDLPTGHHAIKTIQDGLSKWTNWLPYDGYPTPDYFYNQPLYVDYYSMNYLVSKSVINWCAFINALYPISTTGDGNCLPHAVALAMWGIPDTSMVLRRLLYIALTEAGAKSFRDRWQREKEWQNSNIPDGGLQYTTEEWEKEWNILVTAAEDLRRKFDMNHPTLPYESLEEMHVFVLANILKRPIIILGEPDLSSPFAGYAIAQNNFVGIYLPLLWPPNVCYRYPIVLCFLLNHFQPLVPKLPLQPCDQTWRMANMLPLVTLSQEMLHIHFTLKEEEAVAHSLLQDYLYVDEMKILKEGVKSVIPIVYLATPELLCLNPTLLREAPLNPWEYEDISFSKKLLYRRIPRQRENTFCTQSTVTWFNEMAYTAAMLPTYPEFRATYRPSGICSTRGCAVCKPLSALEWYTSLQKRLSNGLNMKKRRMLKKRRPARNLLAIKSTAISGGVADFWHLIFAVVFLFY